ncbi:MAG: DUF4252 domain-containing protein [Melioribacteraceae bacterium]|nr:DUF4252 domain-containing protein [Melioribacteraceae bacterium]WKZ69385.1 MAG: DUF4252 domain-containing protein [Melioribacteraceae bacterium]
MKNLTKYFAIVFFTAFSMIFAQSKDFTNEPGYVDFGDLAQFETGEGVTEVYLEENLLKMVSKITNESEPDVTELLKGLKLIKVNSFEVSDNNESALLKRMEDIDKKLNGKSWQRIVKRKAKDETAYVYVRTGNSDKFTGLVVLAFDKPGEAAFVNIVGDINLETIGKLTNRFDIPALGKVNETDETKTDKK